MTDERHHVLPVYLVADESGSMRSVVDELNAGLAALHHTLLAEPMAAAKVRFTVVGFADTATVRLHLADMRLQDDLPRLGARGGTSYGAVFEELSGLVPADVARLREHGYGVHRPTVFFLTDGRPSDPHWTEAHRRLVDREVQRAAPNIIACGIGDADASTIVRIASSPDFAFVSVPGTAVGAQIARFCAGLAGSMVHTGRMLALGRPELVVERPVGFRLALDLV